MKYYYADVNYFDAVTVFIDAHVFVDDVDVFYYGSHVLYSVGKHFDAATVFIDAADNFLADDNISLTRLLF